MNNINMQYKFTPLLPLILSILDKYQSKQRIQEIIYQQPIKLTIIQKSPNICLSDFKHSILSVKINREQMIKSHPFNKFQSGLYCILDKKWLSLNAKNQDLVDPTENPHPYQPYYHFKDEYEDYRSQRQFLNIKNECQVVVINKWCLKVVNISNTGYYGIVLQMIQIDNKMKGIKFVENVAGISSLIYEKQIQNKLERLRLYDLREIFNKSDDKKAPYSMFYYCQQQQNKPKVRLHNILVADTNKKFINFNQKQPFSLVTFGQIEGIQCLQRPLAVRQIDQQKLRMMNLQNIEILFNGLKMNDDNDRGEGGNRNTLEWSSSDEQQQPSPIEEQNEEQMKQQKDSDSSQGEDPLRNLYLKQFINMKIV